MFVPSMMIRPPVFESASTAAGAARSAMTLAVSGRTRAWTGGSGGSLRLGGLRGVSAQEPIFERSPIEASNNRVHLFQVRRVDKRKALGLLRFGVANHFNRVRDQVFS